MGHKTVKPIVISIIITTANFIHVKTTTRCYYGAGARIQTEKSMEEDRPSSEDLLLQMVNTEANVSRQKKKNKLRGKETWSASQGGFNRRIE